VASTAVVPTAKLGSSAQLEDQRTSSIEPSQDNPQEGTGEEAAAAAELTKEQEQALLEVRRMYKDNWAPKRNVFLRRALRAFEVLKNNPYILYNETTVDYDSLAMILQGQAGKEDIDLYQYQDNIYQMLALSFIAALSVDNATTRYQPVDAQNEEDIVIAKKASTIHDHNERRNGKEALQQLELLYIWCAGSYFTYVRQIIDRNRAGVSKQPIMEMQEQMVAPNRYICPNCGAVIPETQLNPFGTPTCPNCRGPLGDADWFESQSIPMPTKVGEVETPNGMTAFNVYSGLNVDADPDAQELYESPLIDLEVEVPLASVRAQFPAMYNVLQPSTTGDGTADGDYGKKARKQITSPAGIGPSLVGKDNGTYSRCWMQPDAFYILDDKVMADSLKEKFPNGVRLVSYVGEIFLQAVPERMMDHWSWCPTIKGLGLYPFGAGDAALDIQARINDAANTIHAYLDRLAFGTILADQDYIDVAALDQKALIPGNFTGVSRTDEDTGVSKPLSDLLFQPEFHIDSKIYEYEPNLIQLAQVISGVQPQVFGGSDPNVQTASGQKQALNTATGRLMLYLKRIREERAARAKNSVQCTVDNMDDEMKMVMDGETDGDYRTETLLKNELTGDFLAYPEDEEGFPSTYQEIQARITELLTQGAKSPFLAAILSDPDTQRVVARYILPDEIKLPGDAERARVKIILHQLSQSKPRMVPGPTGHPMVLPSIMPNPDFDDMQMAVMLTKNWLQQNWQMQEKKPKAFANVLAFLRICAQMNAQNQIKMQLMAQAAAGGGAPGPGGPGAGPRPIPRLGPGGPPPPGGPPQ
jgi:hypothetical protein